jgi:hypothetical protein
MNRFSGASLFIWCNLWGFNLVSQLVRLVNETLHLVGDLREEIGNLVFHLAKLLLVSTDNLKNTSPFHIKITGMSIGLSSFIFQFLYIFFSSFV